jgi:hypothetical protein
VGIAVTKPSIAVKKFLIYDRLKTENYGGPPKTRKWEKAPGNYRVAPSSRTSCKQGGEGAQNQAR